MRWARAQGARWLCAWVRRRGWQRGVEAGLQVNGGETSTPSMAVQCQGRLAGGRDGVVVRDGVNMG